MKTRRLIMAALLLLPVACGADLDGATVSFSQPSKVGSAVLPPGLYRVRLQGAIVFLTEVDSRKAFTALVKVERTAKKSAFTAAQGRTVEGMQHVDSIVVQGADYKLVF